MVLLTAMAGRPSAGSPALAVLLKKADTMLLNDYHTSSFVWRLTSTS